MQITLNGEVREVDDDISARRLIESLGLSGRRLALEINEEVVPRSKHALRRLEPGDRIEIVHAIGGG